MKLRENNGDAETRGVDRALEEGRAPAELRRRRRAPATRAAAAEVPRVFRLVDYTAAPTAAFDWLTDRQDGRSRRPPARRGQRFS